MNQGSTDRRVRAATRAVIGAFATALAASSVVISASPASAHHTVCKRNYQFVPTWLYAADIGRYATKWGERPRIDAVL